MGSVRNWDFDAVIGVGGSGRWPRAEGIDSKVNWIGIGARKSPPAERMRGLWVTFNHFVLFDEKGRDFRKIAPTLARRMYSTKLLRFVFNDVNETEQAEIRRILEMAKTGPPSAGTPRRRSPTGSRCAPKGVAAQPEIQGRAGRKRVAVIQK